MKESLRKVFTEKKRIPAFLMALIMFATCFWQIDTQMFEAKAEGQDFKVEATFGEEDAKKAYGENGYNYASSDITFSLSSENYTDISYVYMFYNTVDLEENYEGDIENLSWENGEPTENTLVVKPENLNSGNETYDAIAFRATAEIKDEKGEVKETKNFTKSYVLKFDMTEPELEIKTYTKDEKGEYTRPYSSRDVYGKEIWTDSSVKVEVSNKNTSNSEVSYYYSVGSEENATWNLIEGNTFEINEENSKVTYKIKAENEAGTKSEKEFTAWIDSVTPEIHLDYDAGWDWQMGVNVTISNNKENKGDVTIQWCSAREEIEEPDKIDNSEWKTMGTLGQSYTCTIGYCHFYYFRLVSKTGKVSNVKCFHSSKIDSVKPELDISVFKGQTSYQVSEDRVIWTNEDISFVVNNTSQNVSGTTFKVTTSEGDEKTSVKDGEYTETFDFAYEDLVNAEEITFTATSGASYGSDATKYVVYKDNTPPAIEGYRVEKKTEDGGYTEATAENFEGLDWYQDEVSLVIDNPQEAGAAPNYVCYKVLDTGNGEQLNDPIGWTTTGADERIVIPLEGNTKYMIYFYRVDAAGNCSADKTGNKKYETIEFGVDTVAPQVSLDVIEKDEAGNPKAWYGTDVSFKATVDTNQISNIKDFYYEYCIGTDDDWVRAEDLEKDSDEFIITSEIIENLGDTQTVYKVRAVAVSGAGNFGYSEEITIHQDSKAPATPELNIKGTEVNGWYSGNENNLENSNPVASVELIQDEGSPITYTATLDGIEVNNIATFEIPYGTHTITCTAIDEAGHSTSDSQIVKVDNRKPDINVYKTKEPNAVGWYQEDVIYNVVDRGNQLSGLTYSFQYSVDNGVTWSEWIPFEEESNSIKFDETCLPGVGNDMTHYLVAFKAVSGAGRESIVDPFSIKEDKVIPKNVEIAVTGTEGNNNWYQSEVIIKAKDIAAIQDNGSDVTAYYLLSKDGSEAVETAWDGSSIKLEEEGYYSFTYYTRDAAGNQCDPISVDYCIDYTAPQAPAITFETVNGSAFAKVMHFLTFKQFFKEEVKVTITTDNDNLAGLDSLAYWTTENGTDSEMVSVNSSQTVFTLPLGFKGTVSAYATDNAGNNTETMTSDGVVYENVSADITIKPSVDNGTWQSGDVSFHVITQDTESGLRKVTYTLNGAVVYEKDFTTTDNTDVTYMDQSDVTATEEAADANGYNLTVTVVDNAGNESSKTENIYIDKTAPVITLSGVTAGSYANKNQNLTVAVDETIFNYNTVTVTATRTLDGNTENYPVAGFNSTGVHSEQTYSFSEDGTYVVTVSAVDAAGNVAETKQITFSVDKTAPEITLNGVEEGSHNPSGVTAHLSVVESFYDMNNVTVTVTKTLDGNSTNYNAGTWQNTGKISEMSMDFGEDGTYLIEVNAQDAAGNNAVSQRLSFTVDMTAPEVSIGGADDYYISGNTISLTYAVIESYFDTNNVTIDVTREDAAGNITDVPVGSFNSTAKESSLTYNFKEDGIYTSTLTAVDKAGNEATVKKTVTVDTTNPVIRYVDEIDGKYYQVFSLEHSIEEMVEDVTVPTYAMTLNGEEYDGVTEVTDEGKYVFAMDVSDEVGHTAYASAEFIVDNTAPTVIVTGAEDGMVSYDNVDLAVSLSDSDDIMEEVKVGGEEQKFDAETNTYTTRLTEVGTYDIEVATTDLAGNSTVQEIEITIANRSFIGKWFDNKPFFVGSIVCVGGAAGVGGYAAMLARRRRLK